MNRSVTRRHQEFCVKGCSGTARTLWRLRLQGGSSADPVKVRTHWRGDQHLNGCGTLLFRHASSAWRLRAGSSPSRPMIRARDFPELCRTTAVAVRGVSGRACGRFGSIAPTHLAGVHQPSKRVVIVDCPVGVETRHSRTQGDRSSVIQRPLSQLTVDLRPRDTRRMMSAIV
jgi:hypothetical protein